MPIKKTRHSKLYIFPYVFQTCGRALVLLAIVMADTQCSKPTSSFLGAAAPTTATPTTTTAASSNATTPVASNSSTAPAVVPPPSSVTQGSFTAWTVPTAPPVFVEYNIFIQVKLPSGTNNYTGCDLSGSVMGTDGYVGLIAPCSSEPQSMQNDAGNTMQVFPNPSSFSFDPNSSTATLIVGVPGAASPGIQDTINIASTLLNEKQALHLTFQSTSANCTYNPNTSPNCTANGSDITINGNISGNVNGTTSSLGGNVNVNGTTSSVSGSGSVNGSTTLDGLLNSIN